MNFRRVNDSAAETEAGIAVFGARGEAGAIEGRWRESMTLRRGGGFLNLGVIDETDLALFKLRQEGALSDEDFLRLSKRYMVQCDESDAYFIEPPFELWGKIAPGVIATISRSARDTVMERGKRIDLYKEYAGVPFEIR